MIIISGSISKLKKKNFFFKLEETKKGTNRKPKKGTNTFRKWQKKKKNLRGLSPDVFIFFKELFLGTSPRV